MAEKFYMQGNTHKTAIEMYNSAGMWEEAHSLASQYMAADEVSNFHRHYQITAYQMNQKLMQSVERQVDQEGLAIGIGRFQLPSNRLGHLGLL